MYLCLKVCVKKCVLMIIMELMLRAVGGCNNTLLTVL